MVTFAFVTASLFLLLTPGPTNTLLAAYGAAFGYRKGASMILAEATGYAVSVSFFASIAGYVTSMPTWLALMKLAAAIWLLVSAVQLWHTRFGGTVDAPQKAFLRVLFTTMLNPKAMIVGIILIPNDAGPGLPFWIASYLLLSMVAGLAWVVAGSLLPRTIRNHAYQGAAVVLGGFSLAAAASAIG